MNSERIARTLSRAFPNLSHRPTAIISDHPSLQLTNPLRNDSSTFGFSPEGFFTYGYDGMHTPTSTVSTGAESHVLDPPIPGNIYDSQAKFEPCDESTIWTGDGIYDCVLRDAAGIKPTLEDGRTGLWGSLTYTGLANPRSIADIRAEGLQTGAQPATCSMADLRLTAGAQDEPAGLSTHFGSYGDFYH